MSAPTLARRAATVPPSDPSQSGLSSRRRGSRNALLTRFSPTVNQGASASRRHSSRQVGDPQSVKALARELRPFRPTDEVGDLSAMLVADVDQGSEDSRRPCPFTPTPVTTSARLLLLGDRRRLGSRSVGSRRPAGVLPRCEDPAVRAGALPRRPKLEQARHQPWQRRDPRRAHRRRLGAAENRCRELAMRRRAQPRASTHQPARPDFCPCPLHLVSAIRPESFSRNYQSWRPCRAARRLPIRRSAPQLAIKFAPGRGGAARGPQGGCLGAAILHPARPRTVTLRLVLPYVRRSRARDPNDVHLINQQRMLVITRRTQHVPTVEQSHVDQLQGRVGPISGIAPTSC